jgi:hypothetical protein
MLPNRYTLFIPGSRLVALRAGDDENILFGEIDDIAGSLLPGDNEASGERSGE